MIGLILVIAVIAVCIVEPAMLIVIAGVFWPILFWIPVWNAREQEEVEEEEELDFPAPPKREKPILRIVK